MVDNSNLFTEQINKYKYERLLLLSLLYLGAFKNKLIFFICSNKKLQ